MENSCEQLSFKEVDSSKKFDKVKYYVAFSYLQIRPLFKSKLFEYFDYDIEKTFNVSEFSLKKFSEIEDISIPRDFIKKRDSLNIEECFKKAFSDENIKILTYEDEKYPDILKQIPDFPLSLYYKGSLDKINFNNCLAIVGSRMATMEAKCALNRVVSQLNQTPLTIVSGLAYGIDATAHKAALDNNLKTIAVVGSGLDIIYPSQNTQLFHDIIQNDGAIFSEYPLKTKPHPSNFPQRNRIVVGMSHGTFVVEAQKKSGAMISANLTLDYNRELMCLPGNIQNPNTEGIYYLIKNGAGIITNGVDILEQMSWNFEIKEKENPISKLNDSQKEVFNIMSKEAMNFDEILSLTKMEVSTLMIILTELELMGLIKQSNNKYYKC